MNPGILEEMTTEDVEAFNPEVVVWSIGSTEPHGPVLPYGTDYFQSDAAVRLATILANKRGARALMYPTLPIGNNANFKAFPFACRISPETLMHVILDVIEALEQDGIRKIVLFVGHGGNTDTMRATLREHAHRHRPGEGAFVCMTHGTSPPGIIEHRSDHGGEGEVSRMLHLRPDLVHKDKLGVFPWGDLAVEALAGPGVYFVKPWHLYVPYACGGDQTKASDQKGRAVIEHTGEHVANLLVQLSQAEFSETFPYKPKT